MRAAVIGLVGSLGRYTTLAVVGVSFLVATLWLGILETHPILFLACAIFMVPLVTASFALLVGMLFAGTAPVRGEFVTHDHAPSLWQLWNSAATGMPNHTRRLRIDGTTEAWILERRFAGLFAPELTMNIGLGLLAELDQSAIAAVIAHEVAHNRLQHTSGARNLHDFESCFTTLFQRFPSQTTLTGIVTDALLGRFGNWLGDEFLRVSRKNELQADQALMGAPGRAEMARGLILAHALDVFCGERILEPLRQELLGAMRLPRSPLARLLAHGPELRRPETLRTYARKAWDKPATAESTHPSLQQRLAALGFNELVDIAPVEHPAIDDLLPQPLRTRLIEAAEAEWAKSIRSCVERQ